MRKVFCSATVIFSILQSFIARDVHVETIVEADYLLPYKYMHGPKHSNRYVRDCQPLYFGNVTHEQHESNRQFDADVFLSTRFRKQLGSDWNTRIENGHVFIVRNAARTLSVYEPGGIGGCQNNQRAKVTHSSFQHNCLLAVNAGFFNTTSGACLGNVVSNGNIMQNSHGLQNANFGIKRDGSLFFGYVTESDVLSGVFSELVSGVMWLVRQRQSYVAHSLEAECSDTQESGSLEYFSSVRSARTAIGHDDQGTIIILSVEGKTGERGMSLYEVADLMIELGAVNAINLDGGGSATAVVNHTIANYPSDVCSYSNFNTHITQPSTTITTANPNPWSYNTPSTLHPVQQSCEREVSTVLCIHEPVCVPGCGVGGQCVRGVCVCSKHYVGAHCERLQCEEHNCYGHGQCTAGGCVCDAGWHGDTCNKKCDSGYYGYNCTQECTCSLHGTCSPHDGTCACSHGYRGTLCDQVCTYGWYGKDCSSICTCDNSCLCHHVTGECNVTLHHTGILHVTQCLIDNVIETHHLVPDSTHDYRFSIKLLIVSTTIATVSIVINISCLFKWLMTHRRAHRSTNKQTETNKKRPTRRKTSSHARKQILNNSLQYQSLSRDGSGSDSAGSSEEEEGQVGGSSDVDTLSMSSSGSSEYYHGGGRVVGGGGGGGGAISKYSDNILRGGSTHHYKPHRKHRRHKNPAVMRTTGDVSTTTATPPNPTALPAFADAAQFESIPLGHMQQDTETT